MQNNIRFVKYSGSGNDFLIFTAESQNPHWNLLAKAVCERHYGIGSDGMVALIPTPNEIYAYKWAFFNADGSRANMCGNASRCVGHYAFSEGIAGKQHSFLSNKGIIKVIIDKDDTSLVQSDLGTYKVIKEHIIESNPYGVEKWCLIDTGVPHLVGFTHKNLPLSKDNLMAKLRLTYNANVNLALYKNKHQISYITYERGVEDITQSCGTGAAAVFACGIIFRFCENMATLLPPSNEPLNLQINADSHLLFKGRVKRIAICEWLQS